ncbi:hypothetical protein Ddye_003881 [Dipteronia dyeriana]|uniref:Uncharacterized protein n=1 Tax=Dipteronia dyeriana TaxID=168575 RepID=A0AAE0CVQ2_9ROSI|nr:hypothetical protein Ddye_003881 [Dipteronia dyeriana]
MLFFMVSQLHRSKAAMDSSSDHQVPTLTKKQRETRSQLIAKNLNFSLPIKLDQNNFIYWKAQILPVVRAFDIEEFLFTPAQSPKKCVEIEDEDTFRPNEEGGGGRCTETEPSDPTSPDFSGMDIGGFEPSPR